MYNVAKCVSYISAWYSLNRFSFHTLSYGWTFWNTIRAVVQQQPSVSEFHDELARMHALFLCGSWASFCYSVRKLILVLSSGPRMVDGWVDLHTRIAHTYPLHGGKKTFVAPLLHLFAVLLRYSIHTHHQTHLTVQLTKAGSALNARS